MLAHGRFAGHAPQPPNGASRVASLSRVHACHRHYPGRTAGCVCRSPSPATAAFPEYQAGRLLHHPFRGLLSVHCSLQPACSPSPIRTLYTGSFSRFVASTTVPIATGWNDSCRVGISPTERTRLSRRTEKCGLGRFTLDRLMKMLAALDSGLRVTLHVESFLGEESITANPG